jgi:hypothetical protein
MAAESWALVDSATKNTKTTFGWFFHLAWGLIFIQHML